MKVYIFRCSCRRAVCRNVFTMILYRGRRRCYDRGRLWNPQLRRGHIASCRDTYLLSGKGAHVRYIERHYGEGDGNGENIMNPQTIVHMQEGSYMEMETTQIKGIDSTERITRADMAENATLEIREKIMTHGRQYAKLTLWWI